MTLKRFALFASVLLLGLALAATTQAKTYSITGGGGQYQIGGGLPLPIATVMTSGGVPTYGGTIFPPLGIPVKNLLKTVTGTTGMAGVQQKLVVPTGVLYKAATQKTLGQFNQNPNLYAVATNLSMSWPAEKATFSTGARTGPTAFFTSTAVSGGNITYSNVLGQKFGGPAQFRITSPGGKGVMPQVPVTLYGIAVKGPGNPPCTHTALAGPNPACVAGLGQALPTTTGPPGFDRAVVGGPVGSTMKTPGGTSLALVSTPGTPTNGPGPLPGVGIGKFGVNGTPTVFILTPAGTKRGFTNMATTIGYPWTTGMITVSAPNAAGLGEIFMLTGMDSRSVGGNGTIQLVSGGLSRRTSSGPNANRGWIRLEIGDLGSTDVPAMSPTRLAAGAGLLLVAAAFALRRFNR
jgi:hypothetical protein